MAFLAIHRWVARMSLNRTEENACVLFYDVFHNNQCNNSSKLMSAGLSGLPSFTNPHLGCSPYAVSICIYSISTSDSNAQVWVTLVMSQNVPRLLTPPNKGLASFIMSMKSPGSVDFLSAGILGNEIVLNSPIWYCLPCGFGIGFVLLSGIRELVYHLQRYILNCII